MYAYNQGFDDIPEPFRTYAKENSGIPKNTAAFPKDMLFFMLMLLLFYD